MKKLIVIVFFSVLMIILSLNAVSIKEALINYQRGESNRQYWLEQSIKTIGFNIWMAGVMALVPGGFSSYPPFIISQIIGTGLLGGAGVIHNRPEWMRNILGKEISIIPKTTTSPLETNLVNISSSSNAVAPQVNIMPSQEPIIPRVTQPLPIKPELPAVSAPGENIFTALIMAAIAGAGYKFYQWYNAPKKDTPIQEQVVEPLKKEV